LQLPQCRVPDACVLEYEQSSEWSDLSPVFEADWQRRPAQSRVLYEDSRWIVLRFAVLARYFRYVQGYLYLLLPLQHVLQHREVALHAMLIVVGTTHCYSPVGLELGFWKHRRAVVDSIMQLAIARHPQTRARLTHLSSSDAFYDNVCLRLLFIVFGQVFTFDALLIVWDFVLPSLLHGNHRALTSMAAELLAFFALNIPRQADANEDADAFWGTRAAQLNEAVAAELVAQCIRADPRRISAGVHGA